MYQIDIKISASDVSALSSAGQNVAIVQEVASGAFSGSVPANVVTSQVPAVVWTTIAPAQNATLTWDADVAIYQSGQTAFGASIVQSNSVTNVSPGLVYPFTDGSFGAAQTPSGTDASTYYVSNGSSNSSLSFGLTRACSLNGNVLTGSPFATSNRDVLSGEYGCLKIQDQIHLFVGSISGSSIMVNAALINFSTTSISDGSPVTATYSKGAFTFS